MVAQEPLFKESNIPKLKGKENKDTLTIATKDTLITADTVKAENITYSPLKGLFLPLKKLFVTSHFGYRKDPFTGKKKFHRGTDFNTSSDSIHAIIPGKITRIGFEKKGLGNFVEIKNGDFTVIYGHLRTSIGTKGDLVNAGTIIGISGTTGRSTGDHLHLTVKFKGKVVDPLPLMKFIEEYVKENKG